MSDISKETLKTITSIAKSLDRLERAASSIAQASIVSAVYPPDTLQALFFEFKCLYDADIEALNMQHIAHDEVQKKFGELSHADRETAFGKEVVETHKEDVRKAHEWRGETIRAWEAFRQKHPLVVSLYLSAFPKPE